MERRPERLTPAKRHPSCRQSAIKLYGERNTGTNWIAELVAVNLAVRQLPGVAPPFVRWLRRTLPGRASGWVPDLWFACTHKRNLGWKHGAVRTHATRHPAVTITKNPYAWLLSLHRRPYQPSQPQGIDFETFLRTPWQTVGRDNMRRVTLETPVHLWNAKCRSYLGLENAVHIRYQDVLEAPEAFIDRLVDTFGLPRSPACFTNRTRSTKDPSRNFGWYRDYYLNEL